MKKIIATLVLLYLFLVSCAKSNAVTGPKYTASDQLIQGKNIFENSCNKCHKLPAVTKHDDAGWMKTLSRMAPRAKLTDDQHQLVYDYLISVNDK